MHYENDGHDRPKRKKPLTMKEAETKAAAFCAYQERSQQQVRDKLFSYGLYSDEVEEVLANLIVEGFINEERYAVAFAGGKFRIKQWGKIKITLALKKQKISAYCIKKGLEAIEDEDYLNTLKKLAEKKINEKKVEDDYAAKARIARYLIARGFEPELTWEVINELY